LDTHGRTGSQDQDPSRRRIRGRLRLPS
jgi:hypothetical protein